MFLECRGHTPPPHPNFRVFGSPTHVRECHGGLEKGGGRKTSRRTPLPKRSFGPPFVRCVFHPPRGSLLCFSCAEKTSSENAQKINLVKFWGRDGCRTDPEFWRKNRVAARVDGSSCIDQFFAQFRSSFRTAPLELRSVLPVNSLGSSDVIFKIRSYF